MLALLYFVYYMFNYYVLGVMRAVTVDTVFGLRKFTLRKVW